MKNPNVGITLTHRNFLNKTAAPLADVQPWIVGHSILILASGIKEYNEDS